jgi:glutamate N-acetyltransferase/amino-acid N-acetyltransferase
VDKPCLEGDKVNFKFDPETQACIDAGKIWDFDNNVCTTTPQSASFKCDWTEFEAYAIKLLGKSTINGIAKGSGMIMPDMATMLSFLATDAKIPAPVLQKILSNGIGPSFNSVTVDSDTSTSDTVLLFATGAATHPQVPAEGGPMLGDFTRAVHEVLMELALMVARDGEGAQKLIRIDVTGAVSDQSAHRIGMSVANSPLVKTAIAAADANWGRIVMAVGKAGEPAERDRLSIAVGGVWMAREGELAPDYDEAPVTAHMQGREVTITIDIGLGAGRASIYTCDLTHAYIDINGSYRS